MCIVLHVYCVTDNIPAPEDSSYDLDVSGSVVDISDLGTPFNIIHYITLHNSVYITLHKSLYFTDVHVVHVHLL